MANYGFRLEITRPGMDDGTRGILRKQFDATDRRAAESMIDGWAAVEGVTIVDRELIADGETFREAGKRVAMNFAAHLSLRYGAAVTGPYDTPGGPVVVEVTLPNGKGVSLATDGPMQYDPAPAVEALAFTGTVDGDPVWDGDPVRGATVDDLHAIMDRLGK